MAMLSEDGRIIDGVASRVCDDPDHGILDALEEWIITFDRQGRVVFVNRACIAGFRMAFDVAVERGASITELLPFAVASRWRDQLERAFQGQRVRLERSEVLFGAAGRFEVVIRPTRGPSGEILGAMVSAAPVEPAVVLEGGSEDTLGLEMVLQLLDQSPAGIMLTDADAKIQYVNARFSQITGYERYELIGQNPRILKGSAASPQLFSSMWRELTQGRIWRGEVQNRKKSGVPFWAGVLISPVVDQAGRIIGYSSVMEDLTARRSLEEQLRHAQKMDAIGQLAGGVAHDFNNLLTVIRLCSASLEEDLADREELRELASEVSAAADRASALTRQLLSFSRRQVLRPRVVDLREVIADLAKMLRRLLGEEVELVLRLGLAPARAYVDRTQLEQVIINLSVNARDAMPEGGRLTIGVSLTSGPTRGEGPQVSLGLPSGASGSHGAAVRFVPAEGRGVTLTIEDTGTGMSEAVRARIFEPFFTTKAIGRGTGLGLAVVHGIVEQSGGKVEVESTLGRGTTFRIHLAAVPEGVDTDQTGELVATGLLATHTILLVEDDAGLRRAIERALEARGHRVLCASNAEEALAVARDHSGAIDALLSDVILPGGNGVALAAKLRALRPGVRVLYMSGYADDILARAPAEEPDFTFLAKPFAPSALLTKLDEVLVRRR